MTRGDDIPGDNEPPVPAHRPRLAADHAGIGGEIKVHPEDFVVEEIPAYQPSGQGQHLYLRVEKRDVDARSLVETVARRFGVDRRDIGTAGNKDRRGVTRQWMSVDAHRLEATPEPGALTEDIDILQVSRHRNKLRTGHLKGNRFEVRLRDTRLQGDQLGEAVQRVAKLLGQEGLPNYFGLQRFGRDGSTLTAGYQWLVRADQPRGHFIQKMAASAIQSEVFNRLLARRLQQGSWKTVVDGDIFEKTDTGGRFWIDESEREETQRRLDEREIVVTGPMPGSKRGLADGRAGQMEREVLAELGLNDEDFEVFGRRGRGTRRALTVYVDDLQWQRPEADELVLEFSLPAGSYATVLLREFIGPQRA